MSYFRQLKVEHNKQITVWSALNSDLIWLWLARAYAASCSPQASTLAAFTTCETE